MSTPKKAAKKPEHWRPQITVSDELIQKLATITGKQHLTGITAEDTPDGNRAAVQAEIRALILEVLNTVADAGSVGEGYKLGDQPEAWFTTARSSIRVDEKRDNAPIELMSQAEAIRQFLRIPPGEPIVVSEVDLVNAAVRAAREQNRARNYGVNDLIREGIAMVSQSIISKFVASTNRVAGIPGGDNLPGGNDAHYLDILQGLRKANADPEVWFSSANPFGRKRTREITVSIFSRACGTNDNVIRKFLQRHGIEDVVDPSAKD